MGISGFPFARLFYCFNSQKTNYGIDECIAALLTLIRSESIIHPHLLKYLIMLQIWILSIFLFLYDAASCTWVIIAWG